jgi:hypothetical protein
MTEAEARRAVEILAPHFPVAEAVSVCDTYGRTSYAVRTYGRPAYFASTEEIGRFIITLIRQEAV